MKRRTLLAASVVAVGSLAGCSSVSPDSNSDGDSNSNSTPTPTSKNQLITRSANDLVLSIDQLDESWFQGDDYEDETGRAYFVNEQSNALIDTYATVYDSLEAAEQGYDDYVSDIPSNGTQREVSVGEEGVYHSLPLNTCVFRIQNATGRISSPELSEQRVIQFARTQGENY